jgi:uncharacterized RDD family membrane protein YckC
MPAAAPIAFGQPPTEAAIRWRIGAAVIDNWIVYAGYLLICLVLHWRVADLGHALVLLALQVIYHFVLEARDGQTIGKRRYGIKVVALDGGPADTKAIFMRSALRLIDSLPLWYASGLLNMVRTGPQRRQRIGDVAGETKVISVGGRAAAKGTPGWYLPTATLVALFLSLAMIYGAVEAGQRPLNDTQSAQFVAGCERTAQGLVDCQCVLTRLRADGYNSLDDIRTLEEQAGAEIRSGQPGAASAEFRSVTQGCRR